MLMAITEMVLNACFPISLLMISSGTTSIPINSPWYSENSGGFEANEPLGLYFTHSTLLLVGFVFDGDTSKSNNAVNGNQFPLLSTFLAFLHCLPVTFSSTPIEMYSLPGIQDRFRFQIQQNVVLSLNVTAYSDISCLNQISSILFNTTTHEASAASSTTGVWVDIQFSEMAHCVTFSRYIFLPPALLPQSVFSLTLGYSNPSAIVIMDNFQFGNIFSGSLNFSEPSINPSISFSAIGNDSLKLSEFYAEDTLPSTYSFSATRYGVYIDYEPGLIKEANLYTHQGNITISSDLSSLAFYSHNGFGTNFSAWLTSPNIARLQVKLQTFSDSSCSNNLNSVLVDIPSNITPDLKALVGIQGIDGCK